MTNRTDAPFLCLHLLDESEHLALHGHVQRRRRLVRDDELRAAGEGDGDQHALAHAAGQLVRILAQHPVRGADMDIVEQLPRPDARGSPAHAQMQAQHIGDLPPDPVGRVQRRHRILGDEGEAAAHQTAPVRLAEVGDVPVVEHHRPPDDPGP